MPGGLYAPASVRASWPKPNYVDPETRPNVVVPLAIVLNLLLILFSGIRLWIRSKVRGTSGWDDVFYAITFPGVFALTVIVPIAIEVYGYNHHVWDNTLSTNVMRRKYALAIMTIFSYASNTLRISILLFYRRLSQRLVSPFFYWSLWILIALNALIGIVYTLKPLFACQPTSAFWNQVDITKILAGYKYKCFNEGVDIVLASAISSVQDVFTALFPNLLLWRLQVKLRQKIILVVLFSLAYFCAALGWMRVGFNYHLYFESYDVTWNAWKSWLVTMLELQVAALCACAPALKAFLAHYGIFEKLWKISTVGSSDRIRRNHGRTQSSDGTGYTGDSQLLETLPSKANKTAV